MPLAEQARVLGKENVRSITREEYEVLVRLLRRTREEAGVSQSEAGRRIGYSQPIMSAIEKGERRLDMLEFMDLAFAVGFDPAQFVGQLSRELEPLRKAKDFPKKGTSQKSG